LKKLTVALLACAALLAGCQTAPAGDPVANKVQAALKKDDFVGKFDIKAAHSDGKVTLTGNVRNEFQSYHAETVAKGVEGVKSVENNIKEN
jgi:hyperosmotically inducible protein